MGGTAGLRGQQIASAVRTVVYVPHPRGHDIDHWIDAITACRAARVVHSRPELDDALRELPVELVLSTWEPGLFDHVQTLRRGVRVVTFGREITGEILSAAGDGYSIVHAARPEEITHKIALALRPPRFAARRNIKGVFLTVPGEAERFEVLDISNDGLAFVLEPEHPINRWFPGTRLDDVSAERDGTVILAHVSAIVRDVAPLGMRYRVGCELLVDPGRSIVPRLLTDRVACAGVIRSALRSSGIVLTTDDGPITLRCAGAEVDIESRTITLQGVATDVEPLEIVDATFERDACVWRFKTIVLEQSPLVLRLPKRLEQLAQRHAERYRPSAPEAIFAVLESPLRDTPLITPIRDLSSAGMSFDMHRDHAIFPLGLQLSSILLRLGSERLRCTGEVRSHASSPASGFVRCGVSFTDLPETTRVKLADFITHRRLPAVLDGSATEFEGLHRLFREAGFMPPDKERLVASAAGQVKRTFRLLSQRPNALFKSFSVRDEATNDLVGYVSGIAAYSGTYLFQHLAALPGRHAGGVLVRSIIEHLCHRTDYEHAMFFFLRGSSFPTRIFGTFGRKVLDPSLCDMRLFAHLGLDPTQSLPSPDRAFDVHDAEPEDLALIEHLLIARLGSLLVRAHDLTRDKLELDTLDQHYRRLGLFRRRHVLVARRAGHVVGFALAEVSSPGLNLSEGLSSFRLYVLPEAERVGDSVRTALVQALQTLYRKNGRHGDVLGLVDPADVASFERIGVRSDAVSYACTAHRSQLRLFADHTMRLTEEGIS